MAASHRKFLVHPTTNEIFSWHVVETKTNQIISYHRNLCLALDKAERLNVVAAATLLLREARTVEAPRCGYQDDRYSYPCSAPATVSTMSININCIMKILSAPLGRLVEARWLVGSPMRQHQEALWITLKYRVPQSLLQAR